MSEQQNVEPVNQVVEPQVKPEAYEQVKNDMFKYKRMVQEKEQAEQQLRAQIEAMQSAKMEEQGKHKELADHWKKKAEETESRYNQVLNAVVHDKKMSAVREYAIKRNIRAEALADLDMIDLSPVVVETTDQGNHNVLGADDFVEKLQKTKPHWFKDSTPPSGNFSTGDFNGKEKTYTAQEVVALRKSDPEKYKEIMKKPHLITRR